METLQNFNTFWILLMLKPNQANHNQRTPLWMCILL